MLLPLSIILFILSSADQTGQLEVKLTGLRSNKGHVLISLFKDGKGFPGEADQAIKKERIVINNKIGIAVFSSLPSGNYAIAILHDENNDLKMNTNWLGLPKEGYGFSNNVMGSFGSPSFGRASFKYQNGSQQSLTIKVRY